MLSKLHKYPKVTHAFGHALCQACEEFKPEYDTLHDKYFTVCDLRSGPMKFLWLPELKDSKYATYARDPEKPAYDDFTAVAGTTCDPWAALQFSNKPKCEWWIKDNGKDKWVAVEHGFEVRNGILQIEAEI